MMDLDFLKWVLVEKFKNKYAYCIKFNLNSLQGCANLKNRA